MVVLWAGAEKDEQVGPAREGWRGNPMGKCVCVCVCVCAHTHMHVHMYSLPCTDVRSCAHCLTALSALPGCFHAQSQIPLEAVRNRSISNAW